MLFSIRPWSHNPLTIFSKSLLAGVNYFTMVKRKASQLEAAPDATNLRRSTRRKPLAPESTIDAGKLKSVEADAPPSSKAIQGSLSKKLESKSSPVSSLFDSSTYELFN